MKPKQPKHEHKFRQSFLNQWFLCPESARRKHLGLTPPEQNNINLVRGNSVHGALEWFGNEWIETGKQPKLEELLERGCNEFYLFASEGDPFWEQHDPDKVRGAVGGNLRVWYGEVLPELERPEYVELFFDRVLWEDNDRIIRLSGTCDWVQNGWLVDWKNPSRVPRPQDMWQTKRSNLQSHVYTWALDTPRFSLCHLSSKGTDDTYDPVADVGWTHMVRGSQDHDALIDLCLSVAVQIEANLPSAVKQWDSWYCSPKWCGAWDTCRGKFLGDNPF